MPELSQIFTFLFLMLGPFKIIGPFKQLTRNASPALIRQVAIKAIVVSSIALLLAGLLGEKILENFGIPVPILGISAGLILFLVALLNTIKQFVPETESPAQEAPALEPGMALSPVAFPTIVTPYGIGAVIVFLALAPDLNSKLAVGGLVLVIMVINLLIMFVTNKIGKKLMILFAILGAILGLVQVALGFMIMYNQFRELLKG